MVQKLQRIPSQWIETMGRMNVDVLRDFARCVARLADMVEVDSPAWSKAAFSVGVVEFLTEYYIWEHTHLDGISYTIVSYSTRSGSRLPRATNLESPLYQRSTVQSFWCSRNG